MTSDGKADKGSRYCLQRYMIQKRNDLGRQIIGACPSLIAFNPKLEWKSPLPEENFKEYKDDFLEDLGFQGYWEKLRGFWPARGPQWDALALLTSRTSEAQGILLVEAKAHPAEIKSDTRASDPKSLEQINRAFSMVQGHMGVDQVDWTKGFYQLANRLAYLYFLNEVAKIPAWLALINFVNDCSHNATDLEKWVDHYCDLFRDLGISPESIMMDRVSIIFPKAI